MDTEELTCEGCKFAVFVDNGYSNYTTMGTDFYCALDKHPDAPFDWWYGQDDKCRFARICPTFTKGEAIHMDTERQTLEELTPEELVIWRAAGA